MKRLFAATLFFSSLTCAAQLTEKQLKELHENTAKVESSQVQLQRSIAESQRLMDSINMENFNKQNTRNLNAFLAARKEQERKELKRMYWRLGFGILMLVVLVVGWMRKRKKA